VTPPGRSGGTPDRRRGDRDDDTVVPFRARSRIAEAKVYSPRGMTIREAAQRDAELREAGQRGASARQRGEVPNPRGTTAARRAERGRGEEPRAAAPRKAQPRKAQPRAAEPREAPPRRAQPRGAEPRKAAPRKALPRKALPPKAQARQATQSRQDQGTSTRQQPRRPSKALPRTDPPRRRAPAKPARRRTALGHPAPPRRPRRLRVPRLGNPGRRLRFALAVALALFVVLAGRLVQIQAHHSAAYAADAAADKMKTVDLIASRGAILDRNGVELARSVDAVAVDADPKYVDDPTTVENEAVAVARALTGLIGVPESELIRKMSKKTNSKGGPIRFTYLARQLDPEIGQAVAAADLPGINVRKEQRRDVPAHDVAANILGFVGGEGTGLAGIEYSYDEVLRGTNGRRQYEIGRHGQEIPDGRNWTVPAKPGSDVQLTIDRDLQFKAQKVLAARIKSHKAATGAAVVLDIKTQEILAMASYPSYDAAKPKGSTEKTRSDLATGAVVEPGSVHKAITIGAALEEGVVRPDEAISIGPTVTKGGVRFKDTTSHGRVKMTLMGILAQSSNVGTIAIADRLGARRLYEYQRKFGLGSKIGVGLPGESAGMVQPPENWSGPSYGSIPIGLGVAVTPLQMTSVFATIANDGVRVPPTLVRGTLGEDGKLTPRKQSEPERVLSVAAARALRLDLEAVATKYGTAKKAAIAGHRVAGKTGTGKRVENNNYLSGNVASFIGMVPADAPRYAIGIFVHTPSGGGGAVAGPLFAELGSFTLNRYGVAPTGAPPPPIRISVP
jgi:cell division protein FtsI (penicillin-binding protein 3)